MARTSAKLIYGFKNGTLRQLIVPSVDDSELARFQPGTGEDSITVLISDGLDIATLKTKLKAVKNKDAPSGRCVVVDASGNVINAIMADPDLDTHPAGTVVASDLAIAGDKYDSSGKKFTRNLATVDIATNKVTDISFQDISKSPPHGTYYTSPVGLTVGQTVVRTRGP